MRNDAEYIRTDGDTIVKGTRGVVEWTNGPDSAYPKPGVAFRCPCDYIPVYIDPANHRIAFDDAGRLTLDPSVGYPERGDPDGPDYRPPNSPLLAEGRTPGERPEPTIFPDHHHRKEAPMKALIFAIVAAALIATAPQHVAAQALEISAFATSPQKGETDLAARTFGYGFSGHAVFPCDDVFSVVGTIQYHNHDRAVVHAYGVDVVEGDSDFWAGGGLRIQKWNVYAQGLAGFVQKRDALAEAENDTKPAAFAGWGYQPGVVGVSGGWYFSDFGIQYAAGITLRF